MGESGREELDGGEDADDTESLTSGVLAELQKPTPGPRRRSNNAAEDCTFRSSSRNVCGTSHEKIYMLTNNRTLPCYVSSLGVLCL